MKAGPKASREILVARSGFDHTNPQALAVQERGFEILKLRRTGMDYEEIAPLVGLASGGSVYNVLMNFLQDRAPEPVEEVRKMELDRLDIALHAIWPRVENGDTTAINAFLRIQDARIRLQGLEAPKKIDITALLEEVAAAEGLNPVEAIRTAVRLIPQLNAQVMAGASPVALLGPGTVIDADPSEVRRSESSPSNA